MFRRKWNNNNNRENCEPTIAPNLVAAVMHTVVDMVVDTLQAMDTEVAL